MRTLLLLQTVKSLLCLCKLQQYLLLLDSNNCLEVFSSTVRISELYMYALLLFFIYVYT